MNDPLYPHLLEILANPASEHLILGGGFGIRLKRDYVRDHLLPAGERTLIEVIPEVRPTLDLDFFLKLELFVEKDRGASVRALLDGLAYQERIRQWQFAKPLGAQYPDREVIVDLLARRPEAEECRFIQVKDPRVGTGAGIGLHGRETPEAFAVEDSPVPIPVRITELEERTIHVPHPYAWLQMKTAAAWDWLRRQRGELTERENSEKHAFDVYAMVAMLTQGEFEQCLELRERYAEHPEAIRIKFHAAELFGAPNAPGSQSARKQAGGSMDFDTFWETYQQILGLI